MIGNGKESRSGQPSTKGRPRAGCGECTGAHLVGKLVRVALVDGLGREEELGFRVEGHGEGGEVRGSSSVGGLLS